MKLIRKFKKTIKAFAKHRVYSVFVVFNVAVMLMGLSTDNLISTTAFAAKSSDPEQPVVKMKQTKSVVKGQEKHLTKNLSKKGDVRIAGITTYQDSINTVKRNLINEVDAYMNRISRNNRMSAAHIVNKCLEREFDISLLLSQAHLESHFGTYTRGNSCFGIKGKRYGSTNESVNDYIRLIQEKYMITRTPEQLIANNFNIEGSSRYRYATAGYGSKIRVIRRNIINKTKIHQLFCNIKDMKVQLAQLKKAATKVDTFDLYDNLSDVKVA